MKKLSEILDAVGASSRDIENWMYRLELRTNPAKTVPGRARYFSKENVLEFALIAAFVKSGAEPRYAVALADSVMRSRFALEPVRRWWISLSADFSAGYATANLDLQEVQARLKEHGGPPVFAVVDVAEVFRRVDALFEHALVEERVDA